MGPFFQILLALGTLAIPEAFSFGPVGGGGETWRAVGVLGLLPVPYLLAALVRKLALSGRFRLAVFGERLLQITPILGQVFAICLLAWLDAVQATGWVEDDLFLWPGLELFLCVLPFLLLSLVEIDAHARLHGPDEGAVRKRRALQLRFLGTALFPLAGFLAVLDVVGRNEVWRVHLEEVSLLWALFTGVLFALLVISLPRILTSVWNTSPMQPGPMRTYLETLADRAGIRFRDLLVWHADPLSANAMVVGHGGSGRVVLFTESLLASLHPLEIGAVFGHEMGHARRKHVPILAAHVLGVMLLADWLGSKYATGDPALELGILGGAVAVWVILLGFVSRRLELEADLESLALLGTSLPLISALQRVAGNRGFQRGSWRHFSPEKRVHFLQSAEASPSVGRRLRRTVRLWTHAGIVLLVVASALQARDLASSWDEDGILVDLRLGRYEEAQHAFDAGRADGAAYEQEQLGDWIALALSIEEDGRTPDGFETQARSALAAGDSERALLLLELACMRGRTDLLPVLQALETMEEGLRDRRAEKRSPQEWRGSLDAHAERLAQRGDR